MCELNETLRTIALLEKSSRRFREIWSVVACGTMMTNDDNHDEDDDDDDDRDRRSEELEALQAFYGEDIFVGNDHENDDSTWKLQIVPGIDLELSFPRNYPSQGAPTPHICAPSFVLNGTRKRELEAELLELYEENTEVAISWIEHLRTIFGENLPPALEQVGPPSASSRAEIYNGPSAKEKEVPVCTFHPYNSQFGQPMRHFDVHVIENELNRREIHRGQPFHPPRSGPAELMIAHVASVESMDHVNWVLAQLLFHDKKVAKANHNMIAYRFWDQHRNCLVSDNDDDGEKGAGAKLALLLDMANAQNVIVVVSRWFGGVHLGSSRFKHFASVAREALQETGFLKEKA